MMHKMSFEVIKVNVINIRIEETCPIRKLFIAFAFMKGRLLDNCVKHWNIVLYYNRDTCNI